VKERGEKVGWLTGQLDRAVERKREVVGLKEKVDTSWAKRKRGKRD
jgi:hypothetical protein